MTRIKYMVPLAALALLVSVGLSGTLAQEIPGEEEFADKMSAIGNIDDPYLEILKQQDSYLNMTADEKLKYEKFIAEIKENQNPFRKEVQGHLDHISRLELAMQYAEEVGDTEQVEHFRAEIFAGLETLEMYGVTTLDKVHENPHFWTERALEAEERFNRQNDPLIPPMYGSAEYLASGSVGHCSSYDVRPFGRIPVSWNDITPVHAGDVRIKSEAWIWHPVASPPLVVLALLVSVGLGDITSQEMSGEEFADKTGTVGNIDDPYLELLKRQDFYLNMTADEQLAYDESITEYRANLDPFKAEIQKHYDYGSRLGLELRDAEDAGDTERAERLRAEIFEIYDTLETYGITTMDKIEQDPEFWIKRSSDAEKRFNEQGILPTACPDLDLDPGMSCVGHGKGMTFVRTDDVRMATTVKIWYPSPWFPIWFWPAI